MATVPSPAGIAMGSVGSLLERQDFSPEELRAALAGSRASRQPDGLLRKGLGQRELLSYLHFPKKDGKTTKRAARNEPADYATLYYQEHPRASDFSKTSLPERGRFDKVHLCPHPSLVWEGGDGELGASLETLMLGQVWDMKVLLWASQRLGLPLGGMCPMPERGSPGAVRALDGSVVSPGSHTCSLFLAVPHSPICVQACGRHRERLPVHAEPGGP